MPVLLRRSITAVIAWIAGAVISVAVGLLALSMVSNRIAAIPVYPSAADKAVPPDAAVPAGTPTPAPPRPTTSADKLSTKASPASRQPRTERSGQTDRVVSSPGGAALVRCRSDEAYLVSWSPLPGYRARDVRRGPGPVALITFESGPRTARMVVRCVDGVPQVTPEAPPQQQQLPPPDPKSVPGGQPPNDPQPDPQPDPKAPHGRFESGPQQP